MSFQNINNLLRIGWTCLALLFMPLFLTAQTDTIRLNKQPSHPDSNHALKQVRLAEVNIKGKVGKLPDVQKVSVRAPHNISIDGLASEWRGRFKAFNRETNVFYTLSNDDSKLYLVLQARDERVMNKMMEGGVSLIIAKPANAIDTAKAEVLFPLLRLSVCRDILHTAGKQIKEIPRGETGQVYTHRKTSVADANADLFRQQRYIKFTGLHIEDTVRTDTVPEFPKMPLKRHHFKLLPVNNSAGIQAQTRFEDKAKAYTYELAVPLKLLGLSSTHHEKINYQIVLNARSADLRPESIIWMSEDWKSVGYNQDMETKTSLSGEYVLAKF